jgi:DNA repair photolyase
MGCQHGCAFCYCREHKYIPYKPLEIDSVYDEKEDKFSHLIKVKENAPQLLRKALARLPVDMVFTGDYQPVERKFIKSRQMLEVCAELGFPVFVLTRSALVLRDLDVLQAINQKARAIVAFSIIATPDSPSFEVVSHLEGLAPRANQRFEAMEQLTKEGILTGTAAMPLLPGLCDGDENLQNLTRWTAGHGGRFVLGGGLTLADQQKEFFLRALSKVQPELLGLYARLYPPSSYGRLGANRTTGLRLRGFCQGAGISDRVPRPVITGEKRELNKRVVEALANQYHWMELENCPSSLIWKYRKATWAIEDLEQDVGLIHRQMGRKGLEAIENVGAQMAGVVESVVNDLINRQGK